MHRFRGSVGWTGVLALGVGLTALTLACGPGAASAPTPVEDPFVVVRATSEAAYRAGSAFLDRGDLQGCPLIDTAKTNDPDNRAEIQQALERCLTAIAELPSAAASTPVPRTVVAVPTLPVLVGGPAETAIAASVQSSAAPAAARATVLAAGSPVAGAQPTGIGAASAGAPSSPTVGTAVGLDGPASPVIPRAGGDTSAPALPPSLPAAAQPGVPAALVVWRDSQARFSIGAPADWPPTEQPQALFGTGVVLFRDPTGRAEVDVAIDVSTRSVSPELYAASLELSMTQQVPGYAAEQVLPGGSTSGMPSVRRVFTFTQRDAAGRDLTTRGFQVTVIRGSTPYLISGSAPADQFQQFGPTFDQMVDSFRFS